MHNHDNKKEHSWMTWAMMLCCLGPLLLVLLFGTGATARGVSPWIFVGALAVLAVIHFGMMKKFGTHGVRELPRKADEGEDGHSDHGCC